MNTSVHTRRETIARLNDRCRQGLDPTARIVVTANCLAELGASTRASRAVIQARLLAAVRHHQFAPEFARERDRGEFQINGRTVLFRIDYYDAALEYGSEDPADAAQTTRVLTILLPEDD